MGNAARKQKGAKEVSHLSTSRIVKGYIDSIVVFRRLQRTYRIREVSTAMLFLLYHNGVMSVYGLMMRYYGANIGANTYRCLHSSLALLREKGLVVNGGGKWWLTDKGERAIRGDD